MTSIIRKGDNDLYIKYGEIQFYLTQFRPTQFSLVKIPKISCEYKCRLNNVFKGKGIYNLFANADLPDITPTNDTTHVSDIIHQSKLILSETGLKYNDQPNKSMGKHFILNKQFMYYVRHVPTNGIILIGCYK